jgi:hypothetical protein
MPSLEALEGNQSRVIMEGQAEVPESQAPFEQPVVPLGEIARYRPSAYAWLLQSVKLIVYPQLMSRIHGTLQGDEESIAWIWKFAT